MKCDVCGTDLSGMSLTEGQRHIMECMSRRDATPDIPVAVGHLFSSGSYTTRRLQDGTWLVCWVGHNINQNHWHVAPDGTILSVKEGGDYRYNRRQWRESIMRVTGLDIPTRWS